MNPCDNVRHHALAAIAVAALALAGCNRNAPPEPTAAGSSTSNETTATASNSNAGTTTGNGSGSTATGSPGMSGSPGAGGRDANPAGNLNTLPPTAAGTAAASGVPGGTAQALDAGDRKFVTEAAAGGMFEVQVSKLAADKASDPAVKTFAAMLMTDHSNANDELKAFASAHNLTLPASLPKELQAQIDKLQKASGEDFDKQYAQTVGIKDHRQDIARFEKASGDAKNPELKAWVDKTLPTLKEHLAAAQKLSQNGAKTASTH
jgi:putative membrane protein